MPRILPILATLLLLPALPAQEQEEGAVAVFGSDLIEQLQIGLDLRLRGEVRDPGAPRTGAPNNSFTQLRAGVNLDFQFDEYLDVFFELQSRVRMSGNRDRDGVQQGYIGVRDLLGSVDMEFGRFEMTFGEGRMLDPNDWLLAPVTHDGLKVDGELGPVQWDVFWTQPVFRQGGFSTDTNLQGVYATWETRDRLNFDAYVLRQRDVNVMLDRWTWGARIQGDAFDNLNWSVEAATQSGDFGGREAKGDAFVVQANYGLEGGHFVGVEWSLASGDTLATDGDDDTFRPVYMNAHQFNGIADLFIWSNLVDLALRYWLVWNSRWTLHADWHHFNLDDTADTVYTGMGGGLLATTPGKDHLGDEFDLYVVGQLDEYFSVQLGAAYFFAGDAIANNDDQLWLFLQLGLSF